VARDTTFSKNIFINCPFDNKYQPILRALLFTLIYCEYEPRIASERSDSLELRLPKIKELIRKSKYSIHDLSRMKTYKIGDLPRFNMPFEIGIDYGCRAYGAKKHKSRQCLILAEKRYGYQKALSDLSGVDIASHNSNQRNLIKQVRNWIRGTLTTKDIESPSVLWNYYLEFTAHFGMAVQDKSFTKKDIEDMPVVEYMDYVKSWAKKKKETLKQKNQPGT